MGEALASRGEPDKGSRLVLLTSDRILSFSVIASAPETGARENPSSSPSPDFMPKLAPQGRAPEDAMEKFPMTPNGAKRLEEELAARKKERPKISKDIGTAIEHGDLSENAEYHAAKERQGINEAKIRDLEAKVALAEIIDPSKLSGETVKFGATLTLTNLDTDEQVRYQIVGADEAKIEQGQISISAPLARALIGKSIGDEVTVKLPSGERHYEIGDVEYI
jgi:transcription elongation factor GreA